MDDYDRCDSVTTMLRPAVDEPVPLAELVDQLRRGERQLREAIASRDTIGQAKGILMERMRIGAEQAFAVLRHRSQHLNQKLVDVADHLALTGELPPCPCNDGARRPPISAPARAPATTSSHGRASVTRPGCRPSAP